MLEWGSWAAVLAVAGGAVAQRVTGMGFALLAVPFLVLAAGPVAGVVVANLCGVLVAGASLIFVWRQVEWGRVRLLTPAAVLGCLPGAVLIRLLPLPVLGLVIGSITLVALLVSARAPEGSRRDTATLRATTGFFSGFLSVSAGVAGPPLAIYRKAVDWELRGFAASLQVHFVITGSTALLLKWGRGPEFTAPQWGVLVAGLIIGSLIGNRVAPYVRAKTALRLVMIIAFGGTLATIVRALLQLGI